jgi:small subunit ribosomal protein S20
MANIKSAKKRARQNVVRRQRNLNRRSAIKTAVKKVLTALGNNEVEKAQAFLKVAESQLARAVGKDSIHKRTAMRKTSRLAKKVAAAAKAPAKKAEEAVSK